MKDSKPNETEERRARARHDYEAGHGTILELAERHRVHRATLLRWAKKDGWQHRNPRVAARDNGPLARLKRLAERKIELLEEKEGEAASDAAIGKMTGLLRVIERIAVLQQKEKEAERSRTPSRIINDARRLELARRIESIQRQLEFERNPQAAEGEDPAALRQPPSP